VIPITSEQSHADHNSADAATSFDEHEYSQAEHSLYHMARRPYTAAFPRLISYYTARRSPSRPFRNLSDATWRSVLHHFMFRDLSSELAAGSTISQALGSIVNCTSYLSSLVAISHIISLSDCNYNPL
jgi:hypothetical protein